jgi:acetyl-CoA carboxylase carboxyl transferase subunit alpha
MTSAKKNVPTNNYLDFEKPINDLYKKIEELQALSDLEKLDMTKDIELLTAKAESLRKKIYENLEPINIVKLSRHPQRPIACDYIENIFEGFVELHGDRSFGDDHALIGGLAKFEGKPVMVIAQQKGKTTKENIYRNFGMPQPEGYRKALRLMRFAEKFAIPIITLIDTPGAYPGLASEERGVAEAIALNLQEMIGIKVPIISVIIGEGGSGGALGIAIGNTVAMLTYSIYSVISPEGCAAILWRDAGMAPLAAANLGLISSKLKDLGIVDTIIEEPLEGAHTNHKKVFTKMRAFLKKELIKYEKFEKEELCNQRYDRFRKLGKFSEE